MNIDTLINTANDIGSEPDMFHPDYGWIRIDGKLTPEGKEYFEDQLEQFNKTPKLVGRA